MSTGSPWIKTAKRGLMSAEEKREIERLAAAMRNPTPGKIARKMNRHPATVNWYMLTHGLIERKPGRASRQYQRNGKTIYPYSEEHDAAIETHRITGKTYQEIAEAITAQFGIHRSAHSVQVRMVQLAATPESTP